MPKAETRLYRRIVRVLGVHYPQAFIRKIHVSDFQSAGFPDLFIVVDGYCFNLEVKRPGEHPSVIQSYVMRQIRKAGGVACVVRSPDDALRIVAHTLRVRGRLGRAQRSHTMTLVREMAA